MNTQKQYTPLEGGSPGTQVWTGASRLSINLNLFNDSYLTFCLGRAFLSCLGSPTSSTVLIQGEKKRPVKPGNLLTYLKMYDILLSLPSLEV